MTDLKERIAKLKNAGRKTLIGAAIAGATFGVGKLADHNGKTDNPKKANEELVAKRDTIRIETVGIDKEMEKLTGHRSEGVIRKLIRNGHDEFYQPYRYEDAALLDAAAAGDVKAVEQALKDGANIEVRDLDGKTPLLVAAANCDKYSHFSKEHEKYLATLDLLHYEGADLKAKDENGIGLKNYLDADLQDLASLARYQIPKQKIVDDIPKQKIVDDKGNVVGTIDKNGLVLNKNEDVTGKTYSIVPAEPATSKEHPNIMQRVIRKLQNIR